MISTLIEDNLIALKTLYCTKLVNNTSVTVNTNSDSSGFNTTEHRRIEHIQGHSNQKGPDTVE